MTWIGGLASLAIAGFITAYFTTLGNQAASSSHSPPSPVGAPVKVDLVATQPSDNQSRVLPNRLALSSGQLAYLNSLNETTPAYQEFFQKYGAVATGDLLTELVVEGNRDKPVRIVDIQPVVSCAAPLSGTLFYSPPAGSETVTRLTLNLDKPLTPAGYAIFPTNGAASSFGSNYFGRFTISLKKGEQFTFVIDASTKTHYCTFTLRMTVLDGNHVVEESIDDNGQPFRVTAISATSIAYDAAGVFSHYGVVYVGGVVTYGAPGTEQNQFGDSEWLQVNPATFNGVTP